MGTVYRNLKLLVDSGKILAIHTGTTIRYDGNIRNHIHLKCTECGNLIDDLALKSNVVEVVPSAVSIGKAASIRYQDIAISDYSHLEPDYITSFKIG